MKKLILPVLILVLAVGSVVFFVSPFSEPSGKVTITAVGDIMLDRYVKQQADEHGFENITQGFGELFEGSDILIGNLESPITNFPSVSNKPVGHPDNTKFTASPESLAFINDAGFDIVSIGNNHIADFGKEGAEQTERFLNKNGILSTGNPYQPPQLRVFDQEGLRIAFLSYNQFLNPDIEQVVSTIQKASETNDWVIILAHWGEEYILQPSDLQREQAKRFAEAGADIIIGSHPHVIQPSETIGTSHIFYSLGNFVFDQYWHPAVRCGSVLTLTLNKYDIENIVTTTAWLEKDGTTIKQPCGNNGYQMPIVPNQAGNTDGEKPSVAGLRGETAVVFRVIDGDTVELASGETVRYIGINTPETVHPSKPTECYGKEASEANRSLVEGKTVRLVPDITNRDKYNRLLRYVYVDDVFVNHWLVRNGYAYSSSYPPDIAHQDSLREAEKLAREKGTGLWSGCKPTDKKINDAQSKAGDSCVIKGNISHNDNEKIYHLPGCSYYNQTVINEKDGERWFCSEEEAMEAGWRKAKNCP